MQTQFGQFKNIWRCDKSVATMVALYGSLVLKLPHTKTPFYQLHPDTTCFHGPKHIFVLLTLNTIQGTSDCQWTLPLVDFVQCTLRFMWHSREKYAIKKDFQVAFKALLPYSGLKGVGCPMGFIHGRKICSYMSKKFNSSFQFALYDGEYWHF